MCVCLCVCAEASRCAVASRPCRATKPARLLQALAARAQPLHKPRRCRLRGVGVGYLCVTLSLCVCAQGGSETGSAAAGLPSPLHSVAHRCVCAARTRVCVVGASVWRVHCVATCGDADGASAGVRGAVPCIVARRTLAVVVVCGCVLAPARARACVSVNTHHGGSVCMPRWLCRCSGLLLPCASAV